MANQPENAPSIVQLAMPSIREAVRQALLRHRKLGESIVIIQNGKIVKLTGEQILVSEFPSSNAADSD